MYKIEVGDIVKRYDNKIGVVVEDLLNGQVFVSFDIQNTKDLLLSKDLKLVAKKKDRKDRY